MSDNVVEPSKPQGKTGWIIAGVALIVCAEGMRYLGSLGPTEEGPRRVLEPGAVQTPSRIELEQDESLPRVNEAVTLASADAAGTWVALDPSAAGDLSAYLQRQEPDELVRLRDAGRIAQVPNGTKGTVLETNIIRLHVELLDGPDAGRKVHVDPAFVHREGESVSEAAEMPPQFVLEERNGKKIFRRARKDEP